MEVYKIIELIKFFKSINIIETDITSDEERNSGQLVVIVTHTPPRLQRGGLGSAFVT